MKAEDIIKKHIPNGCINLKGITKEREAILVCMKDYARIQIEKDRERVKAKINEWGITSIAPITIIKDIDNTPINLD